MSDGFEVCRAFDRAFASETPVVDGLLRQACLGAVMSEQFRLGYDNFGKFPLECRSDGGMQLLAADVQQSRIGGIDGDTT
jgi:hypothetical protein